MREIVLAIKAILAAWEGEARLDFRGEFTTHTLMTPTFDPGPNPYGKPPVLVGALGPRMTEIAAEVADGILVMPFNSARHLQERTMPAVARGLEQGGRDRSRRRDRLRSDRRDGRHPRAGRRRHRGREGPALVLRLDALVPTGARRRGLGRPPDRVERDVEARRVARDVGPHRRHDGAHDRGGRHSRRVRREIVDRFGAISRRVCCYFPGYPSTDDDIAALVAAINDHDRSPAHDVRIRDHHRRRASRAST